MFISDFSGKAFGPRVPQIKIVVEKRLKTYQNFINKRVKVSEGWETVKELNIASSEIEQVRKKYNVV